MKKLILKHVTNGCFWMNFAVFFKFCTFKKMPENQLLAKKQVTLALMVLFGLFHLLKLTRACMSSDKPEKVLCMFTDGQSLVSALPFLTCITLALYHPSQ